VDTTTERNKIMSVKLVTSNQTDSVRDMANAKGVSRQEFQDALDDGRVAKFLDGLKFAPPEGARIHILQGLRVQRDKDWQEAVTAAGPNTPGDYNVRKVGDLYLPTGTGETEGDYILLNYPSGDGSWEKALAWAAKKGLKNTIPREAFAVGEKHPNLHTELKCDSMYAVATTECTFGGSRRACCVWWHGSRREALLRWLGDFDNASVWFFFRK
jgi:hypothetical protein